MLVIHKATYSGVDVTAILQGLIRNNKLVLKAGNDLFGDPAPGVKKNLEISYSYNNIQYIISVEEGGVVSIPETSTRKLGIFYTNNNHDQVIKASLDSIQKAAEGKADIITCSWKPIEGNPFAELPALTRHSHHLNIIIQILQCLYTARSVKQYDYVSFLEHDVYYPEGYFDYPEFTSGVWTNMNYEGICANGYQRRNADHEPLHQMTMRFTDAIEHFEKLFTEAIQQGSVLLEPQTNRFKWGCQHPALHINHGRHFTSHFSIYSDQTYAEHPYWGHYSNRYNFK